MVLLVFMLLPTDTFITAWKWGKYLSSEALEKGIHAKISSWKRWSNNEIPLSVKSSALFLDSQLIKMDAIDNGYAEGIALDSDGNVSSGSVENIFIVFDGKVFTPRLSSSVFPGITRDTVIQLCKDNSIPCKEMEIPREMLYLADEIFFTGTAAEITPVSNVDGVVIGNGKRGPITESLQIYFME